VRTIPEFVVRTAHATLALSVRAELVEAWTTKTKTAGLPPAVLMLALHLMLGYAKSC